MKVNEKIALCRRAAGMSQEELAARVGVSRQAVSKWELGDATPEVDKIIALSKVFHITTDELLGNEVESVPVQDAPEDAPVDTVQLQGNMQKESLADELPHGLRFLGRLVRRKGYIAGYIVSLYGVGVMLVGLVARYLFGMMYSTSHMTTMLTTTVGMEGFPVEIIEESLGMAAPVYSASAMADVPLAFANIIIVIGLVMVIGGLVLAWYLKKRFSES